MPAPRSRLGTAPRTRVCTSPVAAGADAADVPAAAAEEVAGVLVLDEQATRTDPASIAAAVAPNVLMRMRSSPM